MMLNVPFFRQDTDHTCGPASLQMSLSFLGTLKSERALARAAGTTHEAGTRHSAMIDTARRAGFYCYVNAGSTLDEVRHFLSAGLPVIVHFNEPSEDDDHYAVIVGTRGNTLVLNDPWNGKGFTMHRRTFLARWRGRQEGNTYSRWMMVVSDRDFNIGKVYAPST